MKKENHDSNESTIFLESFIELNKRNYDFKKVKYVSSGDSLQYYYWMKDSGVDTVYLKKYFNSKNLLTLKTIKNIENYSTFKNYKKFDLKKFYKYKLINPKSNFFEYYTNNFNRCELLSIQFIVFNETKDKVLISHGLDCTFGSIDVYSKTENNKWILLKNIASVSN
jgi:hypothetical protein